jgi:hypothetical protein
VSGDEQDGLAREATDGGGDEVVLAADAEEEVPVVATPPDAPPALAELPPTGSCPAAGKDAVGTGITGNLEASDPWP